MNRLTEKHLLSINETLVNNAIKEKQAPPANGRLESGIKDEALLTSVANAPYELDASGDFYIYRSTQDKAVKLACMIAGKKPFKSCNIKTGMISMITLLELNGTTLTDYQKDLKELSAYLCGDIAEENVCNWIKRHLPAKKENQDKFYQESKTAQAADQVQPLQSVGI